MSERSPLPAGTEVAKVQKIYAEVFATLSLERQESLSLIEWSVKRAIARAIA